MLHDQLGAQGAARPDLDVRITRSRASNPDKLARTLHDLPSETRGVGLIALDHPTVREAIRALSRNGIKVVTLATDILYVPRIAYVGIDNRQAGRLAGQVVGRLLGSDRQTRQGRPVLGLASYRGLSGARDGLSPVPLAEEFQKLQIVELREVGDDRERAYEEASALLARHDDLSALYNIGAATGGIARALREHDRDKAIVFIGQNSPTAPSACCSTERWTR